MNRQDFYFYGVKFGNCDFRIFFRPGEEVNVQVDKDISFSAQKTAFKYCGKNFEHDVLLAYAGSKRPESASVKPSESPELKEILEKKMSMTVEEFERHMGKAKADTEADHGKSEESSSSKANKTSGVTVALKKSKDPASKGKKVTTNVKSQANMLTARAMRLDGSQDKNLRNLLNTDVDIDNAMRLSRMFTIALVHNMEVDPLSYLLEQDQGKAFAKWAQVMRDQARVIEIRLKEAQRLMEDRQLKKRELEKLKKAEEEAKKKRKMLDESVESSKKKKLLEQDPQNPELAMNPLQLLRLYTIQKRKVSYEGDQVCFGLQSFPKSTMTNFKVLREKKTGNEYYNIYSLVNFSFYINASQSSYLQSSSRDKDIQIVGNRDRTNLKNYLTGIIDTCPNLVSEDIVPYEARSQRSSPADSGRSDARSHRRSPTASNPSDVRSHRHLPSDSSPSDARSHRRSPAPHHKPPPSMHHRQPASRHHHISKGSVPPAESNKFSGGGLPAPVDINHGNPLPQIETSMISSRHHGSISPRTGYSGNVPYPGFSNPPPPIRFSEPPPPPIVRMPPSSGWSPQRKVDEDNTIPRHSQQDWYRTHHELPKSTPPPPVHHHSEGHSHSYGYGSSRSHVDHEPSSSINTSWSDMKEKSPEPSSSYITW